MADNLNDGVILDCHKCFGELPWELRDNALKTLNKQFYTYRAGHINAVKLGKGAELLAVNKHYRTKKTAIHEAGHVMAVWYGGSMNTLPHATIIYKGSRYHEPQLHITPQRKHPLETLADLFEELCFCLSGRIAESMFFPEEKAHFPYFIEYVGSDIHKAINTAYYMVTMESGKKVDTENFMFIHIPKDLLEDFSCYLIRGYEATLHLLKEKANLLLKVALKLLKKKTLTTDSLEAILGPPRKRSMSLYDRFCAFSMELRPIAKKRYCLNKPRPSKKIKKRKIGTSCSSKRKKSKAHAEQSKKRAKKGPCSGNTSRKRKRSDSVASKNEQQNG